MEEADSEKPMEPSSETSTPDTEHFVLQQLCWGTAPELILIKLFSLLSVRDRIAVSNVCSHWRNASEAVQVWQDFDYLDATNDFPMRSYLKVVDNHGDKFKHIHVAIRSLAALELIEVMMGKCHGLKRVVIQGCATFGDFQPVDCDDTDKMKFDMKFKECLYMFLSGNCCNVEEITLVDVNFPDRSPRGRGPIPIGTSHARTLRKLRLLNAFRKNNMTSFNYLVNLTELTISPEQLQVCWLSRMVKGTSLHVLTIIGEAGMWELNFNNLPERTWKDIVKASPQLEVHCYLKDYTCKQSLLCKGMPLTTLVCCERLRMDYNQIKVALTPFADTLTTFLDFTLDNHMLLSTPASDDGMVEIARTCLKLKTLATKNCLYSSTLLFMVQLNPNLTNILIRSDMIVYKLYVPNNLVVPQEVLDYTVNNFSKEKFVGAMQQALNCDWTPTSPDEYKKTLADIYFQPRSV